MQNEEDTEIQSQWNGFPWWILQYLNQSFMEANRRDASVAFKWMVG